jgi:hypothetical protein
VGIFTVALVISLIVVVIGIVKTVYVPQWMKTAEFEHMSQVSNQFAQLKYTMDIQSLTNGSSVVSSFVTLGTVEIPFLGTHQSFDELKIPLNSCIFSVKNRFGSTTVYSSASVKFVSHNTNFVDQSYIIEGGTLILGQAEKSILLARPSILVTEYGKNITITFQNISLGSGANNFASGLGTYPVYTQVTKNSQQYSVMHNVSNITVQTDYPDAWRQVFNITFMYSGISYTIVDTAHSVTVNLIDPNNDYFNVFIRQVKISTNLAFGVVE